MKHNRIISKPPAKALFDPLLGFIGVFETLFTLPGYLFATLSDGISLVSQFIDLVASIQAAKNPSQQP